MSLSAQQEFEFSPEALAAAWHGDLCGRLQLLRPRCLAAQLAALGGGQAAQLGQWPQLRCGRGGLWGPLGAAVAGARGHAGSALDACEADVWR